MEEEKEVFVTYGSRDYKNRDIPIEELAEPVTDEDKFIYISRFDEVYGMNFELSPWIDPLYDDNSNDMDEIDIKLKRIKLKLSMNRQLEAAKKSGDTKTIERIKLLESHEPINRGGCYGF